MFEFKHGYPVFNLRTPAPLAVLDQKPELFFVLRQVDKAERV